jgi:colanic acid/amylovoran biosynthesis glycosyltransferase
MSENGSDPFFGAVPKNGSDPFSAFFGGMRLMLVTARAPFGRDETFVMEEIHALIRRGHDVRIVPLLPRGGLLHGLSRDLRPATEAREPWSPAVLGAALLELARHPLRCLHALALLLTWKPRPLLANLAVYPKALWLARRARALRIQHLHAHWATTPSAMAMAAACVARVPWSFTAHGYDLLANDLFARKARRAAFFRVISRHGLKLATETCGAPADKAVLLRMGVTIPPPPHATLPPRIPSRLPPRAGPLRLLCPARLAPEKAHRALLEAFAALRIPAELWLAGDGPQRTAIQHLVSAKGLRNVRLLGQLRHEALLDLYRRGMVDGVVLASTREGIPVALMEAMAAGVPVIATAAGGVPELLAGGAGLLVPVGDTAALTWAMETVLRDAPLRARLAGAGRRRIACRFPIDRAVGRLEALFASHVPATADSRAPAGTRSPTSARYAAT